MYYAIAGILILSMVFLPRVGLLAVYENYRVTQKRERVEDALKHLLDREQNGRHASPESLAGTLVFGPMDIPVGRFATLLDPQGAMFAVITLA